LYLTLPELYKVAQIDMEVYNIRASNTLLEINKRICHVTNSHFPNLFNLRICTDCDYIMGICLYVYIYIYTHTHA